MLHGNSSIETLLEQLESDNQWVYQKQTDEYSHVSHLFVAHRRSIELWKRYPEVLIMDNTYETNKYYSFYISE